MSGKKFEEEKQITKDPNVEVVCAAGKDNLEKGTKAGVGGEASPGSVSCSFFFDLAPPHTPKKDDPMSEAALLKALREEYEPSPR
jgi:hypothetical protein